MYTGFIEQTVLLITYNICLSFNIWGGELVIKFAFYRSQMEFYKQRPLFIVLSIATTVGYC